MHTLSKRLHNTPPVHRGPRPRRRLNGGGDSPEKTSLGSFGYGTGCCQPTPACHVPCGSRNSYLQRASSSLRGRTCHPFGSQAASLRRLVLGFAPRSHGRFAFIEDERLQASGFFGSFAGVSETCRVKSGGQGLPTCDTVAPTASQRPARFRVFGLRNESYVRFFRCQTPDLRKFSRVRRNGRNSAARGLGG